MTATVKRMQIRTANRRAADSREDFATGELRNGEALQGHRLANRTKDSGAGVLGHRR
jgi:hypothetical protein